MAIDASKLPIDHGWAWMVLFGACMNQFVTLCVGRSLGLLFVALIQYYQASATAASVLQALIAGISFSLGPIVSPLSDIFTCRRIVMIGGLCLCLAGVLSSFGRSLHAIVYPFGILGGIGVGCVLSPAPIIISRYFDQRRALANGLLFTSAGLSGIVGPILMTASLNYYGIHGTMLVCAGFMLHILVGAALYRPITPPPKDKIELQELEPNGDCKNTARSESVYLTARNKLDSEPELRARVESQTMYTSAISLATCSIADIPAELREPIDEIEVVQEERKKKFSLRRTLHKMCTVRTSEGEVPLIDWKLFKHPPVLLLALGAGLATSSFYLNMLTPAHSTEALKLSQKDTSALLVILGISETLGRLFAALTGDLFWFKPHRCSIGASFMLMAGILTFASQWATTFWTQALYLVIAPYGTGCFIALHVTILVDLVGSDRLSRVWGLVLLLEGAGAAGTPVAIGLLRDFTGDYVAAYQFVAGCFVMSGVCIAVIPFAYRKFKDPYLENVA